jgi:hypothetical protein
MFFVSFIGISTTFGIASTHYDTHIKHIENSLELWSKSSRENAFSSRQVSCLEMFTANPYFQPLNISEASNGVRP